MTDKTNELAAPVVTGSDPKDKESVVSINAGMVAHTTRVVRFRGRAMVMLREPFPHFEPLRKERFEQIAYPLLGGVSRSRMSDVFAYLGNTAEDLTANEDLILFGLEESDSKYTHPSSVTSVWDMRTLSTLTHAEPSQAVWRSPYGKIARGKKDGRIKFIMSLAGGDEGLYDDIMQSIAPLVMRKKPDGVIWWVGDGANGKSTLMDALYKIFPGQLSSITVKRLSDGRDTPSLNGTLGNVVKESSEGRVEDTEIYKAIGTHENFRVHKFHSQDDIEIRGNLHHIFSGNSVPTFNDKGYSARRRTFIIPFGQRFESDPSFEDTTFTPVMFGELIMEMCRYAKQIERQGYRYKWSAATLAAKAEYDTDANNAEEYAKHLISEGVVGFDTYSPVKMDYENWCADNGYVPLGITNLRRALGTLGFTRLSVRVGGANKKVYRLPAADVSRSDLQSMGLSRPGLYTTMGFQPSEEPEEDTLFSPTQEEVVLEPEPEPVKKPESILKGKW